VLGRHPECDIQIDSRKISRRHCCIAQVSDYLVVRDLGSTNGIRINGVRVVEGRLADGDELTLGNNRYKVTWEAGPSSPNPLRPPKKQTFRAPSPPPAVDDELLESCDEPVPLDVRPVSPQIDLPFLPFVFDISMGVRRGERALRDDIRLVGRVLGDTVRQQQGEAIFATVERIRQTLEGLGFSQEQWTLPLSVLSGGQKTRALLARRLWSQSRR